ncbi:MAG: dTDP-4-dehydrorhamnose 3,5-epimerase family protein [Ignavibacteria bacterium]|nr:dTDP-4-dehydrorhamnose 3,5-epimerase family protein [Ignavibacteria bacterium]
MKIIHIQKLQIPDVQVIRFAKYSDERGYFTEIFNINDVRQQCPFIPPIMQMNETFSFANTFRGMHSQLGMGKLIRLIYGRLIDFAMDIRPESGTYMHIIGYEVRTTCEYSDWVWIPPGFAHGTWLLEDSMMEYFCTDTYKPDVQRTIPIFTSPINWSLCSAEIREMFSRMDRESLHINSRDLL